MDEINTISLAKEGHENAFWKLYENHRERIYRHAYRYTRSQQDAEDILQETFIRAFKGIKTFSYENCASFSTWLTRICINCSIDFLRRNKRKKVERLVSLTDVLNEPESRGVSPEETIQAEQNIHLIQNAIQKLSPKQQVIFDLRFTQQRGIREIAERMNCSESSIKKHYSDRHFQPQTGGP